MHVTRILVPAALAAFTALALASAPAQAVTAPAAPALTYTLAHPVTEPEDGWITQPNSVTFSRAVTNMLIGGYRQCTGTVGPDPAGPGVMACAGYRMWLGVKAQGGFQTIVQRAFGQSLVDNAAVWTAAMSMTDYQDGCFRLSWAPIGTVQVVTC